MREAQPSGLQGRSRTQQRRFPDGSPPTSGREQTPAPLRFSIAIGYTANIDVSAYRHDQQQVIFEKPEISGYWQPETFELLAGEMIYIVVDAWHAGGTYGIKMVQL